MNKLALGHITIPLLKGVIYQYNNEALWQALLNMQNAVRDHVAVLGLECIIDEAEGYAFLRQNKYTEEEVDETEITDTLPLPKLIASRPLSFTMSVLCLLLRKHLVEQDAEGGDVKAIIAHEQLVEIATVYLKEKHNEAKVIDSIKMHINRLVELGLLQPLKNAPHVYEVCRIVKALIDADWVLHLNERLQEYQNAQIV